MPRLKPGRKRVDPSLAFVDTSAWIAFLSANDVNHEAAESLIRHAVAERTRLITTNLVLAEVHRLILFRVGIRAAAVAYDKISSSPSVVITYATDAHHRAARAWIDKLDDQVISLTDAVSFAVMTKARCRSAISFDQDFWTAGFTPLQQ